MTLLGSQGSNSLSHARHESCRLATTCFPPWFTVSSMRICLNRVMSRSSPATGVKVLGHLMDLYGLDTLAFQESHWGISGRNSQRRPLKMMKGKSEAFLEHTCWHGKSLISLEIVKHYDISEVNTLESLSNRFNSQVSAYRRKQEDLYKIILSKRRANQG